MIAVVMVVLTAAVKDVRGKKSARYRDALKWAEERA